MKKQNLVAAALAVAFSLGLVVPKLTVWAVEGQNLPMQADGVMPLSDEQDTNGELAEPSDYPEEFNGGNQTQPETQPTEDNSEDDTEEEAGEPAVWPMYLSLGALGLMVVVFIILNLFGGRKK